MVQAVKLLQMCADAGHHVAENRLFKAFKLLERIKAQLKSMQGLHAGDRCTISVCQCAAMISSPDQSGLLVIALGDNLLDCCTVPPCWSLLLTLSC